MTNGKAKGTGDWETRGSEFVGIPKCSVMSHILFV